MLKLATFVTNSQMLFDLKETTSTPLKDGPTEPGQLRRYASTMPLRTAYRTSSAIERN